ncbi:MAG TPA: anaerobic sulfatase maturase [Candidatus Binataceae bacterium]|nr:anaerobic sulfatase maturase [Candidatus Binataceae bacterium]
MKTASREFHIMVKPAGAVCNLDCSYCYYLSKADLYPETARFRMPDDLLERYIAQHIEASPKDLIFFEWHGGEPTVSGLDYFRRIVELQRKHRPEGRQILNGVQTNGTTLDDDWCRFFAEERFHVGLSLDGPKELHDRCRPTKGGHGTHSRVVKSFALLKKHRVSCDVLCVVHRWNVRQPTAVYRFFKELGVEFLQFLPIVMRQPDGEVTAETVPAEAYGEFLCTIFDEWVKNDIARIAIQNFDEALRPMLGVDHSLCIFRETCGDIAVVEHNGDFYCCDHFVDPEHHLGNILETPLVGMVESPRQIEFGRMKRDSLPRYCRECDVLASCNGGCPKDRFAKTPDGEDGLNYLCPGFRRFFRHSRTDLMKIASLRRSGFDVGQIAARMRPHDSATSRQTGRNDLCPCGSAKKYKKCCMGKSGVRPT